MIEIERVSNGWILRQPNGITEPEVLVYTVEEHLLNAVHKAISDWHENDQILVNYARDSSNQRIYNSK